MATSAREMLERLRAERQAQQPVDQGPDAQGDVTAQPERAESPAQPDDRGADGNQARQLLNELRGEKRDRGWRSIVRSFNKGIVDMLAAPTDLFNWLGTLPGPVIGERAAFIPGTAELRKFAADTGMTAKPGQEGEGMLNRGAEILGGSAIPAAGMLGRGKQVVSGMATTLRDVAGKRVSVRPLPPLSGGPSTADRMMAAMAESPRATAAAEAASSLGAGVGGEVASKFSDDPTVIAIGELAGGFSPAALVATPTARATRYVVEKGKATLIPFTRAGAEPRAARALQSRSADPQAAAERIDPSSTLSPARQTGERKLLALERAVLDQDPALDARFSEQLVGAARAARDDALALGGDVDRPRRLLERGREHLLNLVNVRAAQAARAASDSIAKLDPNASPRELSRAAREHIEVAYDQARATERQLWNAIDKSAPAELANTRRALSDELATRSAYDDPDDIPAWLRSALDEPSQVPDDVLADLRKAGMLEADGSVPPRVMEALRASGSLPPGPSMAFRDVHAIRKRVRRAIQEERAAAAPNRNKIRILSSIEDGLLDDLAATNVKGVGTARAFSRELNEKFTQGSVGKLLGFERRGGRVTDPADTLQQILSGQASATKLAQFLQASPAARPQVEQFVKSSFLMQATDGNKVNKATAERFIRRWRERGLFEAFPALEAELSGVKNAGRAAERWGVRASSVERMAHHAQKSRAALYLNAEPGEEMNAVLRARNPAAIARSLVRRMQGDRSAVQGLKTLFSEALFKQSAAGRFTDAGEPIVSGARFAKLLKDYRRVGHALGMTDAELARLNRTATTLRLAELQAAAAPGGIVEDAPATILELAARLIGAKSGQRLAGSGFGSSLVMAQFGSQRVRQMLGRLTRDKAQELVIAAHSDPALYRALLLKPTASAKRQAKAAKKLEAWLIGVAVTGEPAETSNDTAARAPTRLEPPQAATRPRRPGLKYRRAAERASAALARDREPSKRDVATLASLDDGTLSGLGLDAGQRARIRESAVVNTRLADAKRNAVAEYERDDPNVTGLDDGFARMSVSHDTDDSIGNFYGPNSARA